MSCVEGRRGEGRGGEGSRFHDVLVGCMILAIAWGLFFPPSGSISKMKMYNYSLKTARVALLSLRRWISFRILSTARRS